MCVLCELGVPPDAVLGLVTDKVSARANEGVDKGEIWMYSYEFARHLYKIRTKFIRICTNPFIWIGHRLVGFCHFSFWVPFGRGGCFWGTPFTG